MERSTKKEQLLLQCVDDLTQANGYGPSYREIMRAMGYKSVSTVAVHIDKLVAKGYLQKRQNAARSLEIRTLHSSSNVHTDAKDHEDWLRQRVAEQSKKLSPADQKILQKALELLIGKV